MTSIRMSLMMLTVPVACIAGAGTAQGDAGDGPLPQWAEAVGQPVDISPWAYSWRADRAVQETPEACFIPRRLERLDRVYRTAMDALPPDQLKSIYYDQPDLLRRLPPAPEGNLLAGLLWTGGLSDYAVELQWPAEAAVPDPGQIEVRTYPTAFGWFGWTVDKVIAPAAISEDGRRWTYRSDPNELMDTSYSTRIPAATEMVAVFAKGQLPIPRLRVSGPGTGVWTPMDLEVEWGFLPGSGSEPLTGRIGTHVALLGDIAPLPGDTTTTVSSQGTWSSHDNASGRQRRGLRVSVLYAPTIRPGLDSRVTLWTSAGDVTFSVKDLEAGPIYLPRQGLFICRAGSGETGAAFATRLQAEGRKSLRQMTREHREPGSWDELMEQVRFWTCPEGTPVPPFPQVPDPAMTVELSDARWTGAWRCASDELCGRHLWPTLSAEIARAARVMELLGLHDQVMPVYDYFLGSPGVKSDGDFTDPAGSLEWATAMRHDMGYSHEGTHASTGRLLWAMCDRYFLTGDAEWLAQRRDRLQAAADWIISERTRYMEDVPNRSDLHVAGLMPPSMLGDYALPACDWHWYYCENAWSLQGLQRFADVLAETDPTAAEHYSKEAEDFRRDLRAALDREAALAPVRKGWDGAYHSYLPRMAYGAGLPGPELGAPQFPDCDLFLGALPAAAPFAALEPTDPRVAETLDLMDEWGTSGTVGTAKAVFARPLAEVEQARAARGLSAADTWFWQTYSVLPKISDNASLYLLQDDIPAFLRSWMDAYAGMVAANGKLWEHWHLGSYGDCDAPDTMTAAWFLENFRNLLVMEDGDSLWVGRGIPRAWLEEGKHVAVRNAPTYFGTVAFEITSEAGEGAITARIVLPNRRQPASVLLRLRHPNSAPIRSATVNGQPWSNLDPAREVIRLTGVTGEVTVTARY